MTSNSGEKDSTTLEELPVAIANKYRSIVLSLHKDNFYLVCSLLQQSMIESVPPVLNKLLRLINNLVLFIDLIDLPIKIQEQFMQSIGT